MPAALNLTRCLNKHRPTGLVAVPGLADAVVLFAVFVHHGQVRVQGAPVVGCASLLTFVGFGVTRGCAIDTWRSGLAVPPRGANGGISEAVAKTNSVVSTVS